MEPIKSTLINLNDLYGYTTEKCFYCSEPNGSISMGFSAQKISVHEYQDLLDRGWTRCGLDYYKKDVPNGCCKLYTIRMEAARYQMRKSHRKVLKKWNRYLAGEDVQSAEKEEITKEKPKKAQTEEEIVIMKALTGFMDWIKKNPEKMKQVLGLQENEILQVVKEFKVLKGSVKKYGDYTTNLLMLLFIGNQTKLSTKEISDFVDRIRDLTEEILGSLLENIKVNIQQNGYIGFVLSKSAQKSEENSKKHQVIEEETIKRQPRKFEIKFEKAGFDKESFGVYQRYCKETYKKDTNEAGYEDFLCLQGLEFGEIKSSEEEGGKVLRLGCYHMKYYVDEKLIAVGVVDLLPKSFSAAYFFYEPEYRFLSLGVIGAIKEIEYIQEMQKYFPEFRYYYLGFYVPTYHKMAYKAEYRPSEILCPHTYCWVEINEEINRKIEKNDTRLSKEDVEIIEDMNYNEVNLEEFVKQKIVLDLGRPVKLAQIKAEYQEKYINIFKDIASGIGKKLSGAFVFGYNG